MAIRRLLSEIDMSLNRTRSGIDVALVNEQRAKSDATAVILTGGKSSRMGQPKALLLFDGEPLIVHMVRNLARLFADTVVVAAPQQELPELPSTIVRDDVAYQGPVGGIYYGLKAASREICFVISCDAPFLNLRLISYLMSQITDYDVVVPFAQERFQPLHAVYRQHVAPLLKEQLERGELRPIFLYDKVRTRKITEDEIQPLDPEGLSFLNMNTPEDYDEALKRWKENETFSHLHRGAFRRGSPVGEDPRGLSVAAGRSDPRRCLLRPRRARAGLGRSRDQCRRRQSL